MNKRAFNADKKYAIRQEVLEAKDILLRRSTFTMCEVYRTEDVGDITLYLAIAELLEEGCISGMHPYEEDWNAEMTYTRIK